MLSIQKRTEGGSSKGKVSFPRTQIAPRLGIVASAGRAARPPGSGVAPVEARVGQVPVHCRRVGRQSGLVGPDDEGEDGPGPLLVVGKLDYEGEGRCGVAQRARIPALGLARRRNTGIAAGRPARPGQRERACRGAPVSPAPIALLREASWRLLPHDRRKAPRGPERSADRRYRPCRLGDRPVW